MANPKDTTAFLRFACLLPKVGEKTAIKLLKIASSIATENMKSLCQTLGDEKVLAKVPKDAIDDWKDMSDTLTHVHEVAGNATPSVVVEEAISGWYQTFLRATYENWPRREEDLESLIDFASKHESLAEMLSQLVLLSSESGDRVVKQGERCIRLSTIHQSKGLEYPHVFIIGLADGLFPNKRAIDGEGDLEEERRLFYVATTRAERSLHLLFPTLANQKGTPVRLMQSRFIKELPESRYELINAHSHHRYGKERAFGGSGWGKSGGGYRKYNNF